jgi:hypothetical protein
MNAHARIPTPQQDTELALESLCLRGTAEKFKLIEMHSSCACDP